MDIAKPTWALYVAPFLFTGLLMIAPPACTAQGKLDPHVAPIVDMIDDAACKFVPSGGAEICEGAATLLDAILKAASVAGHPEPRTFSVVYQGHVVARKLTKREAERVRRALEEHDGGTL